MAVVCSMHTELANPVSASLSLHSLVFNER